MQNRLVIASVALVLLLGAFLCGSRRPSYVDIEGHVYERFDPTKAMPVAPVSGARVSNDWDSTAATTDRLGAFHLRVRRVAGDEWIKFTARAGDMAACERRLGSLRLRTVDIFLKDPMPGRPGRCQPNEPTNTIILSRLFQIGRPCHSCRIDKFHPLNNMPGWRNWQTHRT
jgi:hypothetical protein